MATVQFMYGRTGRVLPQLIFAIEKARMQNLETIVLVPEQYTLEAERQIMDRLGLNGLLDITVLSPTRLNRFVQERAGKASATVLNSHGVNMAMSLTLTYAKKSLGYYQSVCEKQGFVKKMTSLIQGLKKGGMSYEDFALYAENASGGNARKIKNQDIKDIWRMYENTLEGRFLDAEDEQADMLSRLEKHQLFQGMALFVYGFDMLSEKIIQAVALAATQAAAVGVFMLMDEATAPDGDIYAPMRYSLHRLETLVKEKGEECRRLPIAASPLPKAGFIGHLEENIFAKNPRPFGGEPKGIKLHCALNPYQEAIVAVRDILRLHENGTPFENMAVLLLKPKQYDSILPSLFKSYGIPFYMAQKSPAASHGLVRFVITALEAIGDGYSNQTIISHLKTGYTLLSGDECYRLENYIIAHGIHRKKFLVPFTRGDDAQEMENCRERLMAPLQTLRSGIMEARDAVASMTAVFQLLKDVGAYEQLLLNEQKLLDYGMESEAAKNRQVWQLILSILEQMADLLGSHRAPGAHVAKWLAAGLIDATLSALPKSAQEVLVGELGHVMPGDIKAAWILGFQDDALSRKADSLLSDDEMTAMKSASGLPLIPMTHEMNCLARCDLIKAVSLPEENLFISYADASASGEAQRPNGLIDMICRSIFPGLSVTGSLLDEPYDEKPIMPLPALEALAFKIRSNALDPSWRTAYHWLMAQPDFEPMTRKTLNALQAETPKKDLPPSKAKPLFHSQSISISRLELFSACPYQHFVHYGLRPQENPEYAFSYKDKGVFFHEALKAFVDLARIEPDFPHLTKQRSDTLLQLAISKEVAQWKDGPLFEDVRSQKKADAYIRTASHAAWLLIKHAQNGDFVTIGTELRFGDEKGLPPVLLQMEDGSQVALEGVVDRVDSYQAEGPEYLRVVDYKSSAQQLKPEKMMNGLQLQLLLYFDAMLNARPGSLPAGAFYFHVNEPMVELEKDDPDLAERTIAGKGHLSGIAIDDKAVLQAMGRDEEAFSAISNMVGAKGEIKKTANVLSQAEWEKLLKHTKATAQRYAGDIIKGCISRLPSALGDEKACAYCPYDAVCLKDPENSGEGFRVIPPMKMEEMKEILENLYPDKL